MTMIIQAFGETGDVERANVVLIGEMLTTPFRVSWRREGVRSAEQRPKINLIM
jgi:hypothetical protein